MNWMMMIFSDQFLEINGAEIWTGCLMLEMKTGATLRKANLIKHQVTTLTETELNQGSQFQQKQNTRMASQQVKQLKNTYSPMETNK